MGDKRGPGWLVRDRLITALLPPNPAQLHINNRLLQRKPYKIPTLQPPNRVSDSFLKPNLGLIFAPYNLAQVGFLPEQTMHDCASHMEVTFKNEHG